MIPIIRVVAGPIAVGIGGEGHNIWKSSQKCICGGLFRRRRIKMLIRQNVWRAALLRLSRHSSLIRATADRLTLVELNNFIKIDVKSRR
jgi:hypothetical protein